jgi:TonB family protein
MRRFLSGLALLACLLDVQRGLAQETPALTKPPTVRRYVEPRYPKTSSAAAEVLLSLQIDAAGRVVDATVSSAPQPGFDEMALEAARQLEFVPAEVDGKPAPVRITFRYRFAQQSVPAEPSSPPAVTRSLLRGRVVWKDGGGKAAGVELAIPSLNARTRSAADGSFSFGELEPGLYGIELSGEGIVPTVIEQRVPAASDEVVYQASARQPEDGVDEEIVISLRNLEQRAGSSTMEAEQARRVPGVMGDALNVVQMLPGVSAAASGSGQIVVWGAAPAETRILIDDVPVPALYHRGGFRSVIHDGLVSSVEVIPAGFGPEYGQAIGGVVRVTTAPLASTGIHGELGADLIGASAEVSVRPSPALVAAAAGRVGYLDLVLPAVYEDVEDVTPLSAYRDYAAKARLDSDAGTVTELLLFGSFDDVERRLPSNDPKFTPAEHEREAFHRVSLSRRARPRAGVEDRAQIWVGLDDTSLDANFDNVSTELQARAYRAGARASRRFDVARSALTLGCDVEGSRTVVRRFGTLGLPAREGDSIAFGQAPAGQIGADEWTVDALTVAGYVQADMRWGQMLEVSPGFRVEPVLQAGDRALPTSGGGPPIGYSQLELALGPRLAVEVRPRSDLALRGAGGLYQQPPAASDLSPVFGGTRLSLTRAAHGLLGAALRPWSRTAVEALVFHKYSWDLVTRSAQEPPAIGAVLVNDGQGRAYGAQLVLRQESTANVSGWLSYAISRSERRDHPDRQWRLSDHDQTHSFTAAASYAASKRWDLGVRLRAASGLPRTEVSGAFYDARLDRYQPLFGRHNGIRLPASFQLDLHAAHRVPLSGVDLSVYLDLLNVTAQRNAIEIVYNEDYTETAYLASLPTLAVLGARVQF